MTGAPTPDSPIEAYLDDLLHALSSCPPRQARHLLAEAEAHLREDAAAGVAAGLDEREAEHRAVGRFGPAEDLAAQERARTRTPYPVLARQVLSSGILLGAVGMVAVGASGLVAEVLRLVAGPRFVIDTTPGQHLAAADCARWLRQDPGAGTCQAAAVADWIDEVVGYRIAAGFLGLLVLAGWWVLRRRRGGLSSLDLLPAAVRDTVALTLFGGAAVWAAGLAVNMVVVNSGRASGQWLSAALVSAAAAGVFAVRLVRRLRDGGGPNWTPPARAPRAAGG